MEVEHDALRFAPLPAFLALAHTLYASLHTREMGAHTLHRGDSRTKKVPEARDRKHRTPNASAATDSRRKTSAETERRRQGIKEVSKKQTYRHPDTHRHGAQEADETVSDAWRERRAHDNSSLAGWVGYPLPARAQSMAVVLVVAVLFVAVTGVVGAVAAKRRVHRCPGLAEGARRPGGGGRRGRGTSRRDRGKRERQPGEAWRPLEASEAARALGARTRACGAVGLRCPPDTKCMMGWIPLSQTLLHLGSPRC